MTDNAATARNDGMAKTGQEQESRGRSLALACACAHAADAKKATDVLVFDLAGLSDVCDAIVVCRAWSTPSSTRSRSESGASLA